MIGKNLGGGERDRDSGWRERERTPLLRPLISTFPCGGFSTDFSFLASSESEVAAQSAISSKRRSSCPTATAVSSRHFPQLSEKRVV